MSRSIRSRSTALLTITTFLIVMPAIAAVAHRSPQAFPEVQKVQEERGIFSVITILIAGYAASIATAALVWNIIRASRDRARLKMVVIPEYHSLAVGVTPSLNAVKIVITNVGRRPISLRHWGAGRKSFPSVTLYRLDKTLKETESTAVFVVKTDLRLPEGVQCVHDIKGIFVKDSAGKEWTLSTKQRRRLIRMLAQVGSTFGSAASPTGSD